MSGFARKMRNAWRYFKAQGGLATAARDAAKLGKGWDERRFDLSERYNDWRLGIRTTGNILLADVGVAGWGPKARYEPTDYRSLRRALRQLDGRPAEDVFLDYGSGKGRAVVLTAMYPFRRVIGVELSEQLNGQARANVARARAKLACRDIELITADATAYHVPDDVTCIYMYNPFRGQALADVMGNIRQSLDRRPRKLTIIFKNAKLNPAQFDWLRPRWQFPRYRGEGVVAAFESK